MKTKYALLALVFTLGITSLGFAGNNPAIPPSSGVPLSEVKVGMEVGPKWVRKTVIIEGATVSVGAWYRTCPVMPGMILNPKTSSVEVKLSNGKRITLSCGNCKDDVERNLEKYEAYMY